MVWSIGAPAVQASTPLIHCIHLLLSILPMLLNSAITNCASTRVLAQLVTALINKSRYVSGRGFNSCHHAHLHLQSPGHTRTHCTLADQATGSPEYNPTRRSFTTSTQTLHPGGSTIT